ncbi:MAG TPA: YHS domain-containing protein [Chitinophagaceae bacterium]|nr:YHS domain-containing protein [Chitinophagaceae bacterium]
MRNFLIISVFIMLVAACNNAPKEQPSAKDTTMTMAAPAKDFSKLSFAAKRDVVCRMPLTAGIGDTATYKGKLYGFCSKECKDEFKKDPAGYVAKNGDQAAKKK